MRYITNPDPNQTQPYVNDAGVFVIPRDWKYARQEDENAEQLVAAYCRVSTLQKAQEESFETQKLYYEDYISKRTNWTLVDIYADRGISATSIKRRADFIRMIEDCKAGKITRIITKSVSRFARNTVDCIATCRMLKALDPPVGVFFEMEGLNTLAPNSEMFLVFLSGLAEGESSTKSVAVKWGIRGLFEQNKPKVGKTFGFDKDKEDKHNLLVNEDSRIVAMMYDWAADGLKVSEIIDRLYAMGIKSPKGCDRWSSSSVYYILTNEKYCGDALMQKTFVVDLFSHKTRKNTGQEAQYLAMDKYEPIVSREQWNYVQRLLGSTRFDNLVDLSQSVDIGPWSTMRPVMFPSR